MLTRKDFNKLARFALTSENPGYKPNVIESPDGDGVWDTQKRYGHVAPKYFRRTGIGERELEAQRIYNFAMRRAMRVCQDMNLPPEFYPGPDSTLRVLEYPPGATTAPHCDFDLFTLCLYRNDMDAFRYLDGQDDPLLKRLRVPYPGIHFGEILSEVLGVTPTRHEVVATEGVQHSAVFFVIPAHQTRLPSGITVGQWLDERKARSRKEVAS